MAEGASGTTVSVHRCRFVDYTPSAITALAFPPLPLPSLKGKENAATPQRPPFGNLVVGRANGNIELCEWTGSPEQHQSAQAWVVKKTLSGPYPSKVDSLTLTIRYPDDFREDQVPTLQELRLFTAGGGSNLAEWDIQSGCIRRTVTSQGGSIWSVSPNPSSTLLALGCEDGSIRILSLENDSLTHLRRLDRVKCRILSLAWGPPVPRSSVQVNTDDGDSSDDDGDDWSDSWIVAGCSDSCLRKWDISSGRVLERMGTDKLKGEKTLVWTVGVLGDGTIISGDSLGMVKFWDPRTGTQLQSFQGHGADVLCLTISPDGTVIYTSGVDQKVVQFSAIKSSPPKEGSSLLSRPTSRWVQLTSRRLHSHDVRALAIWPPYSPLPSSHKRVFPSNISPILVSGGLDMSIVLTPVSLPTSTMKSKIINPLNTSTATTFEDSYHRRVAYSSGTFGRSGVCLAKSARLVLAMRETGISIWRILKAKAPVSQNADGMDVDDDSAEKVEPTKEGGFERVLDMELNVHSNIVAGAISSNGKWVAVSDWYETKLFKLETLNNGDLKPKRIRNLTSVLQSQIQNSPPSTGASCFIFTPDSTKLIVATAISAHILILDLNSEDDTPRVLRKFDQHRTQNATIGRVTKGRKQTSEDVEMGAESEQEGGSGSESESEEDEARTKTCTVTRMATSSDGQWLASTDDQSRTHIFNLDAIQYECVLPSFPHPIHALAFDPSDPSILVLGLANNTIQVYDVESRQFPPWSYNLTHSLPQRFTQLHDSLIGVTFDLSTSSPTPNPQDPNPPNVSRRVALFWGSTWICKVQLDAEVGYSGFDKKRRRDGKKKFFHKEQNKKKGSLKEGDQPQNFKMITQYRPMLLVDFLAPGELVVVERPLVDVLAKLPPAFFKPKYGAT